MMEEQPFTTVRALNPNTPSAPPFKPAVHAGLVETLGNLREAPEPEIDQEFRRRISSSVSQSAPADLRYLNTCLPKATSVTTPK